MRAKTVVAVGLVVAALLALPAHGRRRADEVSKKVLRSDIKHIRCKLCRAAAQSLADTVNEKRAELGKRMNEAHVLEIVEGMCNPEKASGAWTAQHDIVQRGTAVVLERQPRIGHCHEECSTLAFACERILGKVDTEIAELLWKEHDAKAIEQQVCHTLTTACEKEDAPVKGTRKDFEFDIKTHQELAMEKMTEEMGGLKDIAGMEGAKGLAGGDDFDTEAYMAKMREAMDKDREEDRHRRDRERDEERRQERERRREEIRRRREELRRQEEWPTVEAFAAGVAKVVDAVQGKFQEAVSFVTSAFGAKTEL